MQAPRILEGGYGGAGGAGLALDGVGGDGGVGRGSDVNLGSRDFTRFQLIRGGYGGAGGPGQAKGGNGGDGEAPKLSHYGVIGRPISEEIKALLDPLPIKDFCARYSLDENIQSTLESQRYQWASTLLDEDEDNLTDIGFTRGDIGEMRRALQAYVASAEGAVILNA
ncbi:hypothetical protein HMN09_01262400 [Mycena chlorophos]|uniref:Uncharacterized protein n=1 Tax=Mycena chlorophos TaxID=658473 RepID=A0A8H6VVK1_MYCCL|nr:hypothetical protein HMN09_01262400 [Mycena chlorophos]